MDLDEYFLQNFDFEEVAEKNRKKQDQDTEAASTLGDEGDCDGCKI
ncbi:TPA: hypothetical protein SIF59_004265 [Escherichia coli]|nr:hypothetical protein [Escherichia coli]